MSNRDSDLSDSRHQALARAYVAHSSARDLARIEPMFDAAEFDFVMRATDRDSGKAIARPGGLIRAIEVAAQSET